MTEAEAWVMIPKLDNDKTGYVLGMRPLVLCKDCKYWEEHHKWVRPEGGSYIAPRCNRLMKKSCSNWFCADGRR